MRGAGQRQGEPGGTCRVEHQAQVLDEDVDGAVRGVVAGDDVGDPVLEHPAGAGRVGDDVIDLLQGQALFGGEGDRLARGGDVHAGQMLVDHLEGRARARFVAQPIDLGRHRLQGRVGPGEGGRGAGGHDRELAISGANRPAADRGVQIVAAGGLQTCGEGAGLIRVHGHAGDIDRAGRHGFGDARRAEQHRLGLGGVDHHPDDDLGSGDGLGGLGGGAPALGDKAIHRRRRHIVADHVETGPAQGLGHAKSHRAQADDGRMLGRRHQNNPGLGAGDRSDAVGP